MTYSITANNGAGSSAPILIEGWTPSRSSRNVIHDLLDGSIGVSFQAPRPRSGTLRLLFTTEAEALAAFFIHGEETAFTLSSTDSPSIGMKYAVNGSIDFDAQAQTRQWWVMVGYQELSE